MYNKKYIIEYLAGCKGDFLSNFLNLEKLQLNYENKSKYNRSPIKVDPFRDKSDIFDINDFEKRLLDTQKINKKYITSHSLHYTHTNEYQNLLSKYNFFLYKIIFDKKFYRTIYIEDVIKNIHGYIKLKFTNNYATLSNLEKSDFLNFLLTKPDDFIFYEFWNNDNLSMFNKKLINYETLYIEKNLESFEIFDDKIINDYKSQVEKTWCPDEINLFDKQWNLKSFGYRI